MNKEHNTQTVNIFTAGQWNRMKTWLEESVEGGLMFHTSSRFFLCTSLDISLYRDYPFAGNTLIIVATTSCTPVRPAYRDREGERKRGKRASLNPEIYGPVSSSRVSLKVLYLLVLSLSALAGHVETGGGPKCRHLEANLYLNKRQAVYWRLIKRCKTKGKVNQYETKH